jgi:nucleoside-triphosphatase THEP1
MNEEQQSALDAILDGDNVFITGGAGVGKSYLVSHIRDQVHNLAITAMTGCEVFVSSHENEQFSCPRTKNESSRLLIIADAPRS